jgi:hypothetical protein
MTEHKISMGCLIAPSICSVCGELKCEHIITKPEPLSFIDKLHEEEDAKWIEAMERAVAESFSITPEMLQGEFKKTWDMIERWKP